MTTTTAPTIAPNAAPAAGAAPAGPAQSIAIGGDTPTFWDVALRNFGLLIAAIALARLAAVFAPALPFGGRSQ